MVDYYDHKSRKVTTTVSKEDYSYSNKHNLKFAHMIRAFLRDHRVAMGDPDADVSVLQMKKKVEAMAGLNHKAMTFIEKKNLSDEFLKEKL